MPGMGHHPRKVTVTVEQIRPERIGKDGCRSEFGTPQMSIVHTRSCCSSAANRLDTPRTGDVSECACMRIGNAGQIFDVSLIGLLFVQNSRRFKRRVEENAQIATFGRREPVYATHLSRRTSSGSMPIVTRWYS